MRRKVVFLLILLGTIGIIFGVVKYLTGRSPKQGVLKVTTSPETSVFLDNNHLGRSPFEDKVDEGEYTIKLVPDSTVQPVSSWQGKIKVMPNLLTYVNADLADSEFNTSVDILWLEKISSSDSEIAITTNPDGASVTVDGEPKGNSPLLVSNVTPGDHTIAMASTGFAPRTIKVKTTPGYKLIASVKMALSAGGDTASLPGASPSASLEATPSASGTPTPTTKAGQPTPTEKAAAAAPDKPYITIDDTPTGFLRVRMGPTTTATEAGKVDPGQMFHVLDTENGWYKISYDGENDGWVSGQYATETK